MGIHKLMTLINDKAPKAIKEIQLDTLTGKTVCIDASMSIYQFLISTQTLSKGFGVTELRDKDGNHAPSTAHAAEQSAQIAAENIKLDIQGKTQKKSYIKISGVLVALGGKNASVVLFDKFKFSGKLGYYLKSFITSQYKRHLDKNAKRIHDLRNEED